MRKYITIIKTEFQRQLTYRSDIASFVFGDFVHLFGSVVLWSIIYSSNEVVRGYTYPEMMTYIVIGWIFMYLTANYNFENKVSHDIHYGRLTNFLVRPMSYLRYTTTVASGRVVVAFFFIVFQAVIYVLLFKKYLISFFNNFMKPWN